MNEQINIFSEFKPIDQPVIENNYGLYTTKYDKNRNIMLVADKTAGYRTGELKGKEITQTIDAAELIEEVFDASNLPEERFYLIALDAANQVSGIFEVSHGTLNASIVHPREIFVRAILCGAASIIIAHNHPSGSLTISKQDREVTNRIREAGEILGISLVDHVICAGGSYVSAMF